MNDPFDNGDHVMVDVTADPYDDPCAEPCDADFDQHQLPADFCTRCSGNGTRGGVEWLPAMSFVDRRTGEQHTSTAGYGFVSRLCRPCNGTGLRINGKRKRRRLLRLARPRRW